MTKTDRFVLTVALTLIFCMILLSIEGFAAQCEAIRGETLRLHIIAASDSENDQRLKLLVRDALLSEYSEVLGAGSANQAAAIAEFLKEDITVTAQKTLREHGCPDNAEVSVQEMYFDTRSYQNGITLPAGRYLALRVVIGEGKGQNWWCVIYPPLCIPAASSQQAEAAAGDILALEQQSGYQAKFAVVELAQKAKSMIEAM